MTQLMTELCTDLDEVETVTLSVLSPRGVTRRSMSCVWVLRMCCLVTSSAILRRPQPLNTRHATTSTTRMNNVRPASTYSVC